MFGQNRQGLYTKIELRGLLRGDFKSQQEGFEVMRRNGIINADRWLELADMEPMPKGKGGDKYLVQGQMVTLEQVGKVPSTQAAQQSQPAEPDDEADPDSRGKLEEMAEEDADAA